MTVPAPQRAVARFLAELAGTAPIETHVSAVFVGSDTVWKMKKAVALPYLDFCGLEVRRRTLERELALNKPFAPDLYRDVVPLVQNAAGHLALGGSGEVVEWVLRMVPIPPADLFERIAAEGRLSPELAHALGRAISGFHSRLAPLSGIDPVASLEQLVTETRLSARASGFGEAEVLGWEEKIRKALATRTGWLRDRAAAGCIRHAHGDLHLRNICLWHGKPVPFDALEFDERLASIDLGFDLAFLLMDCDLRVGRATANHVFTSYVAASGDTELVGGLVPFLSLRAMTRAHVERAGGDTKAAQRYFAAAVDYLALLPPALLAVGGLPGTGKSTLARALAPALGPAPGALVLSSDVIRKRCHGVPQETRLPPEAYTAAAGRVVAAELLKAASRALHLGHAVILDATFLDPVLRRRVEDVAGTLGVPFLGLWLEAPLPVLEGRIEVRGKQAVPDPSDATIPVLRRFARTAAGPATAPEAPWRRLSALTPEGALTAARVLTQHAFSASLRAAER